MKEQNLSGRGPVVIQDPFSWRNRRSSAVGEAFRLIYVLAEPRRARTQHARARASRPACVTVNSNRQEQAANEQVHPVTFTSLLFS